MEFVLPLCVVALLGGAGLARAAVRDRAVLPALLACCAVGAGVAGPIGGSVVVAGLGLIAAAVGVALHALGRLTERLLADDDSDSP